MSVKAKRRSIWGILLIGLLVVVMWDITTTVARKQDRFTNPILVNQLQRAAPKQNSVVGICQSTDPELGTLQAALDATLTYEQVDSITRLAVQRAGGFDEVIESGDWVLVKPNILTVPDVHSDYPWTHVGTVTDLRVMKSVIEQLIEEGDASRITVAEGKAWRKTGDPDKWPSDTADGWTYHWAWYGGLSYEDMLEELDATTPITIDYVDLDYPPYTQTPVPGGGLSQSSYFVPNAILNCDRLIAVAVMKTHVYARVTLTNKLYIGTSPASVYNAGYFNHHALPHISPLGPAYNMEQTICDLMSYHPADFGIVECFRGMEGTGPHMYTGEPGDSPKGPGISIKRNVVLASKDPVAVDAVSAYVMGFNPWDVDHLHWNHGKGFGINDLDYISTVGPALDNVRYTFAKPSLTGFGGYQGRGNRIWLVNGWHSGVDLDYDYFSHLGGEANISPVESDTGAGETWTAFTDATDYMDLAAYYGNPSSCITYAFTRIVADSAMNVRLRFGSDDGIKIWLNGSVVYSNSSTGTWSMIEQDLPIALQEGTNRLLVKIKNSTGPYGFSMFVSESDGDTPLAIDYCLLAPGAPEVTLDSPASGASTSNSHMQVSAWVSDPDDDLMTVWVYGDTTPGAAALLHVEDGVSSGSHMTYDWHRPVLGVDDSTIGLWHFDEGSGTTIHDASPHGLDGYWVCQDTKDSMWTNDGAFGHALEFYGFRTGTPQHPCAADWVEIPEEASPSIMDIDPSGDLTIEYWIKPDVLPTSRYWGMVVKRVPCEFPQDTMQCGNPANYEIFFNYSTQTLGYYANTTLFVSTVGLTVGQWQYIAVTIDGSTGVLRFYKNGVLGTQLTGAFIGTPIDGPLRIGSSAYRMKGVDGWIDEVRLTAAVLDSAEIAKNYRLATDRYYWKVAASDGVDTTTSGTRYFDVTFAQPDTNPPEVTLNSPSNDSATTNPYMELSVTVTDESPMTVWIYGDATVSATDLLYVEENVTGTDIFYDWTAPVLEPETGHTMGLWHLDEGTGTSVSDESENTNSGSFSGDPSWTADGRFGYAIEFDGTGDYLVIPDDASLDVDSASGAITMEAWVYPHSVGGGTYRAIFAKRGFGTGAGPCNYEMFLNSSNGNLGFYAGHWPQIWVSSIYVPPSEWSYLAITLDASEGRARFYRNGGQGDSLDAVAFGGVHDYPLYIGVAGQVTECFDGLIDEARITDRVLSASEIAANYRLGSTYYWKVRAEDTSANDSTSEIRYFHVEPSGPDTDPPEVTLNSPSNDSVTTNPYMELSVTVTDQSPMTVWIYGDATTSATDLLYVEENVTGTDILYDWTAPVMEPETGHTMGLWHLDEGTGTSVSDESENTNSGSFSGDPSWTAGGRFGYGIDFDGTDDYLVIPDDASLDVDSASGAITMEAWVYPHSVGGGTWRTIIGKRVGGASSTNYEICIHRNTGTLAFYSGHWPQIFTSTVSVPSGEWSYVAVTVDAAGGDAYFYRNGAFGDVIEDTVVLGGANDAAVTIGSNTDSTTVVECFDGLIDEVRITDRVLSAGEIAANYRLGSTYYWKVRAEDTSANDSTSEIRYFHVEPAGPDTDPPEITLNSPLNDSVTTNPYMQLSVTVTDESPMTVWIYGDATASATDLLYVEENVTGTDILYDWTAPVLEPETGHTMGLWHLDEGTGTSVSDESENTNSGSFSGDPSWTAGGRFGYGIDFDGTDDYLVIPDDASLDVDSASGAITMEAWVYPHSVGGGTWRTILGKRGLGSGPANSCNYEMGLDQVTGNLYFYSGRYPEIYISDAYVPPGEWSYVAITLDAIEGRVRFYRNGAARDSIDGSCFGPAHDYALYVGVAGYTTQCFDGLIDEVRLTDRVLSTGEIAANYRLGSTYYWKVRAEDTSANDSTSEIRYFHVEPPGPDTDPPEITLNSPTNGSYTTESHMELNITVTDQSPMTVWIYGDTTASARALLYVEEGVTGTDIIYDWTAPVMEPEAGYTMGLWHFDENVGSTVYDSSGNANDGSFAGDPAWTADGRFGYALDFDGTDDCVSVPDDPSLDIPSATGTLTMEAWIYPHAVGNGYHTIFCKRQGSSINYQISLDATTGNLLFYRGLWPEIFVSTVYVPAMEWSYVAMTLDANTDTGIFYRNGIPGDTVTIPAFGTTNDGVLYFGVNNPGSEEFDGLMDEMRLTNRVLSAEEIAANYRLGSTYYWKVRAEDTSANDSTSETWHFTVGVQPPPAVPTLIAPADLALLSDNTPTFEWSSTAGDGGTYTLEYALDSLFVSGLVTIAAIPDTFYTIPGGSELSDTIYYWHVQAVDSFDTPSGYQTHAFMLAIDATLPAIPTLLTPEDGSYTNDMTPMFSWTEVTMMRSEAPKPYEVFEPAQGTAGAKYATPVTYTLQYALDSGFSQGLVTNSGLSTNSYTPASPLAETTYYWRVEAVDEADNHSGYPTPFSFTIDITLPSGVTEFAAEPGHQKISLTWTNPSGKQSPLVGTLIRRVAWGNYPWYLNGDEPDYPGSPAEGDSIAFVPYPEETYIDNEPTRDIYYYAAFAKDEAGNYSPVDPDGQDRSTSYWLGDFTVDGYVEFGDLMVFSNCFGTSQGEAGWNAVCDIGPTDDYRRTGIPEPDSVIDFEDLMIFAMNFWHTEPVGLIHPEPGELSMCLDISTSGLELPLASVDEEFEVAVVLQGTSHLVKGMHIALAFDPTSLELVSITEGSLLRSLDTPVFFRTSEQMGGVEIHAVLLGTGATFSESGEVAKLKVRVISEGETGLRFGTVDLRSWDNVKLTCAIHDIEIRALAHGLPKAYTLQQNHPNPFRDATDIRFQIPKDARVSVNIYDAAGMLVRTLADDRKPAGYHVVHWDGRDNVGAFVPAGVYFYRLSASAETESRTFTRKMIRVR